MRCLSALLFALVLTACGGTAAAPQVAQQPTQTTRPVVVAATLAPATVTLVPTHTPAPTLTPDPTSTLAPTSDPTSTPLRATLPTTPPTAVTPSMTPEPPIPADSRSGMSPEMIAYVLRAAKPADAYGKALRELGEQASKAGREPKLLGDPQWKATTHAVLTRLEVAGLELGAIQPVPSEADRLDSRLKQIAAETGPMVSEYRQVVDRFDLRQLGSASRRLEQVGELFSQVGKELESYRR